MKKLTLTVGIPAFNEQQTIEGLLLSLMQQKLETVTLERIIVISDGSTDKTNQIVTKLSKKYPFVYFQKDSSQKGKYYRVNQLFQENKSDVLIILDADIALKGPDFLEQLARGLTTDTAALMMSADLELIRPRTFVGKVLHTTFYMHDSIRLSIPAYDSATNFHGAATAYKKKFTKKTVIPEGLSDPHAYIYFSAKQQEGFRYNPDTRVLHYAPDSLVDMKKIMSRSIGKRDIKLESLFGTETIQKAYTIPRQIKLKGLGKTFLKYPFHTVWAIEMTMYLNYFLKTDSKATSPLWDVVQSTKKPIHYIQ